MQGHQGKVLFIAKVYSHLAAFHIPFMKLLQNKGYEVYAAASSEQGRKEDVEATGVTCWEIPFKGNLFSISNLKACLMLYKLFKKHRFNLIHVHTPVAAFMGRLLAKYTEQGEVLYTAHGFHFYKGAPLLNWLVYYNAERIAAHFTDGLIVINDEDLENAKRLGFKPGVNLFLVNGVGVEKAQYPLPGSSDRRIRLEIVAGDDEVLITCVAEFNKNKNHAFLVEAWAKLNQLPVKHRLLLVGSGEEMLNLSQKINRKNITGIHFMKYRKDVHKIIMETDIFVLVSKREGLPKSIMEAMAAGKPVIATNVRGNRDLVKNGRTGILVEPGDVTKLANALETLIKDRELRISMGEEGFKKIQDYSLDKIIEVMAGIYDRFLGHK